ncbi:hypothetical protein L0Y40_02170 [Candidatus Wolfebacteria bacterium]|nr:hypothetical protein [Candidatus Wolfebacteria bacterium]
MNEHNASDMKQEESPQGAAPQQNTGGNRTLMSVLAYIGPLVIISYLFAKDNPFVKFHIKQGLVLFVIEIVAWFLGMMVWVLWPLVNIVNLITLILSIVGIVNVVKGREKMLPLVGSLAKHFPI